MNQGGVPPYTYLHNFLAGVWDQVNGEQQEVIAQ